MKSQLLAERCKKYGKVLSSLICPHTGYFRYYECWELSALETRALQAIVRRAIKSEMDKFRGLKLIGETGAREKVQVELGRS